MSAYRFIPNRLRTTRIKSIQTESSTVKTFTLEDKISTGANPGQFLMLWLPGVDEIPLSILETTPKGTVSVVVKDVGEATATLHRKQTGAIIGLRGPFGNGFSFKKGKTLLVAGGIGIVPLFFAAKKLVSENRNPLCVLGAQTKAEILFKDKLEKMIGDEQVILTTDDGSYGDRGLVTTSLQRLLTNEQIDLIYTCGPEKMMRKVFDVAEQRRIPLEASLERLMRCAVGLCGSCVIGKYRVCRDGPVFTSKQLRSINDFGNYQRDFYGKRVPVT